MTLVRADSIAIPLADESVDLIVTSPPYFALRSYTDGGEHYDGQIGSEPTPQDFLEALWAVLDECYRVLKPSGSCWVNLGDKYGGSGGNNNSNLGERATKRGPSSYNKNSDVLSKSLMGLPWRFALGAICPTLYRPLTFPDCWHEVPCTACRPAPHPQWIGRAEVVWSKPNGLPESVTDRVRRSHEQWFHFTREPRYFAAVDEVREPHSEKTLTHRGGGQAHGNGRNPDNNFGSDKPRVVDPLGKLPGSVWTIPSEPLKVPEWLGVDHFAAYPQEWPRRIILGWSPSGICTRCGEGRRPVVAREAMVVRPSARRAEAQASGNAQRTSTSGTMIKAATATITGYACHCDTPDAPTRPAVVLDPFGGTGTTAMVARALGRYPVHLDLSADYLRLARWRIYDSGHAAKTVERTNREAQGVLL